MESKKVCITGISGYLGSWVLKTYLDSDTGFSIRGTVRDPHNKKRIDPLRKAIGEKFDEVELVAVDLNDAASIDKAIEGCNYVVHTASPFPVGEPKNEDDVIKPAVEGTQAVLDACRKHKVRRLVVTSSIVSIVDYARDVSGTVCTEDHWLENYGKDLHKLYFIICL